MTSPAPESPVDQKISDCWKNGNSIGETRVAIKRNCGVATSFEQIRHQFAALSHIHAQQQGYPQ